MKRYISLFLCVIMMLAVLTGCGAKSEVKELLGDYQKACRELDMEDMAECFNPKVVEPIMGILNFFGVEMQDVNDALGGIVSFANEYSQEDLPEIYQSIKVTPQGYTFNDAKDECDVSAEVSFTVGDEKKTEVKIFHCEMVDDDWYIFNIQ